MNRIWELLAKKFSHEISDHERLELEELLRTYQHDFQQSEMLQAAYDLKAVAPDDDAAKERSEMRLRKMLEGVSVETENVVEAGPAEEARKPSHIRRFSRYYIAGLVNVAAIALIFVWPLVFSDGPLYNKINTERGAKTTVHLPDGSVVTLNSGSRLSYSKDFGVKNREIKLEGEAYFDVVKNPNMPMLVSAGSVEVKVLGTTFNVKAYPEDSVVEASLFTGAIQLMSEKDPERVILLRPREKVTINRQHNLAAAPVEAKGETVSLKQMLFNQADSSFDETAWMQNKLVFKAARFRDVANELQRKFNTDIQFNDAKYQDIRITGTFAEENIQEIIQALQETIPFEYTISGHKIYISQ
ncbi:FecR domain-containing protein [Chitinophaga sp.]|uniref:FecR family protein n=1 Tax=Chitinophaga sp. TaxID=1869181 RepID=UPI00260A7FA8|nr:FecR domain-containing protein [uncultured Chitinophaga sp.]